MIEAEDDTNDNQAICTRPARYLARLERFCEQPHRVLMRGSDPFQIAGSPAG